MEKIRFADHQVITGGLQEPALMGVKVTRCVNSSQELTVGSVCAAMIEFSLLGMDRELVPGERVELLADDVLQGTFLLEKPEKQGDITVARGYDPIVLLDKDMTSFLESLNQWPYSLTDFCHMVCQECGLPLLEQDIPNGSYPVEQFSCQGITGRELMMFAGQLCGQNLSAIPEGVAAFGWYTPEAVTLAPGGESCYLENSLSLADYQTQPIEKVQLQKTSQDVGAVYPQVAGNTYRITANPMFGEALEPVAQSLYEQLKDLRYTPGSLKTTLDIWAGAVVTVQDQAGAEHSFYVMESVREQGVSTLTCRGSASRDSVTAVNNRSYSSLSGKVLELEMNQQGLRLEHRDAQESLARVAASLEGLTVTVQGKASEQESLKTALTELKQTAQGLELSVKTLENQGTTRLETALGLKVDGSGVEIHRQGAPMTNRLNEQGMYILRQAGSANETVMLQADAQGVLATDVTVRNYLCVGTHARFEDYTDGTDSRRTACFYC